MREKQQFTELAKAQIQPTRNAVISYKHSKEAEKPGEFVLAQQIVINEAQRETVIFMKRAVYIKGLEELYNLRDALNAAIGRYERFAFDGKII